ncbi:hypothetical protein TTHERM_000227537 (macronuclear) [Tetrahymena thermophila SB210]|uniref:Uncharacterized protein n=1 Tax=Tetrahymena thermophila (strain SB210) TaxID=312017 RepID=W7XDL9_TETTS|nr:hypothetical protein TTHERM_000227537 [Tetrahymena thermophila SB210]EWS74743.1 hypothetical protein TTHERM_000227537 [Tetrahymena thermophila SB210]|eukprot:XP_012652744.1 hypothetical protein TTHERM_000227537 [Tetrahymena thermophila SB210]
MFNKKQKQQILKIKKRCLINAFQITIRKDYETRGLQHLQKKLQEYYQLRVKFFIQQTTRLIIGSVRNTKQFGKIKLKPQPF